MICWPTLLLECLPTALSTPQDWFGLPLFQWRHVSSNSSENMGKWCDIVIWGTVTHRDATVERLSFFVEQLNFGVERPWFATPLMCSRNRPNPINSIIIIHWGISQDLTKEQYQPKNDEHDPMRCGSPIAGTLFLQFLQHQGSYICFGVRP